MKKMAAHDFENLLQVCPVFERVQFRLMLLTSSSISPLSLFLTDSFRNHITKPFWNYFLSWLIGMA